MVVRAQPRVQVAIRAGPNWRKFLIFPAFIMLSMGFIGTSIATILQPDPDQAEKIAWEQDKLAVAAECKSLADRSLSCQEYWLSQRLDREAAKSHCKNRISKWRRCQEKQRSFRQFNSWRNYQTNQTLRQQQLQLQQQLQPQQQTTDQQLQPQPYPSPTAAPNPLTH